MQTENDNLKVDYIDALTHKIIRIKSLVSELKEKLSGKQVSLKLADHFKELEARFNNYDKNVKNNSELDEFRSSANGISIFAQTIITTLQELNEEGEEFNNLKMEIGKIASDIKKHIDESKITYSFSTTSTEKPITTLHTNRRFNLDTSSNEISKIKNDFDTLKQGIATQEKLLETTSDGLEKIRDAANNLNEAVKKRLEEVDLLYESKQKSLEEKDDSLSKLLSHASNNLLAGSYGESAVSEQRMADLLRYGSLFCMGCIIFIVGYSFFETINPSFKWETAVLRFIFAIFLSIPAAYLARESTKHRQQQYDYLQTSLDLKAIAPYIASLPPDAQHKLKAEIANRLFASKNYAHIKEESYPINSHEILVTLLNKLEFPGRKDTK